MPFRKIDTDVKERALQLIAEGQPIEHIIEVIEVSCHSVDRWADNYEAYGSVKPPLIITG
jgi:transposase-like protein